MYLSKLASNFFFDLLDCVVKRNVLLNGESYLMGGAFSVEFQEVFKRRLFSIDHHETCFNQSEMT